MKVLSGILFLCLVIGSVMGQDGSTGPQLPIVLQYADSLVGMGMAGEDVKEFIGNVKFTQGNVTVKCDRAIHENGTNRARLFGNVVITQGGLVLRTQRAFYDGNAFMASAEGGVRIDDDGSVLTSKTGTYSTKTHKATFVDSVFLNDDTLDLWAEQAWYNRDTKECSAWGSVVAFDSVEHAWMRSDSLHYDRSTRVVDLIGNAEIWSCKEDTTYIVADTIHSSDTTERRYFCSGDAQLVRGQVAARADSMDYRETQGLIRLSSDPTIWSDSMQLIADTITLYAPNQELRQVIGEGNAIMVSRSDSVRLERYDQVSGDSVVMYVDQDTVRLLVSIGTAKSITWRLEEDKPEGLAQFAADTIKASFMDGTPVDIYWLGGVHGEHHPENIASAKEAEYKLPGFWWRVDKPFMQQLPVPFSKAPPRMAPSPRRSQTEVSTGKKR